MTKHQMRAMPSRLHKRFHPLRMIALLMVFCLLTDPLTESAFSSGMLPQGGMLALRPIDQTLFRQTAFNAPLLPIVQENSRFAPFNLLNIPWQHVWSEAVEAYLRPKFTFPSRASLRLHLQALATVFLPTLQIVAEEIARPSNITFTPQRFTWNGWVANFNPHLAVSALKHYTCYLKELSIFGAGADPRGRLVTEDDFIHATLAAIKPLSRRPRVLLTVANNRPKHNQDRWLLHQWLDGPEQRQQHIANLLVIAGPVDGLDIDYENLRPKDGLRYTQFLEDLGLALHARGKYLSITVEPRSFCYGGIDWKVVSAQVDRVRIMAYQFHYDSTRPGAISPPEIVDRLAKRALTQIPAEKLEIALPLYGYDWDTSRTVGSQGHGEVVATLTQFKRLARQFPAWSFRDPMTQSARIDYVILKQNRLVRHEVWFEDPASLSYKVRQLQRLGIAHIGVWQLGVGDLSDLFPRTSDPPPQVRLSNLTPWQFIATLLPRVLSQYDFHLPTLLFSHQTAMDFIRLIFLPTNAASERVT